MNPKIKELRKKAMQLPLTPGVYLMKNSSSEIIYVGKAKALKNRVSQYFGSEHNHTVKVRKMVENVDDFDVILTDSEFEALVLECSLIKQHSPKYNILLKDDKGYSYIKVTPGKWRNIYAVLQREDDGAKYIGPYMSSFAARNTVDEAKKIFRLPQCNKVFPRDFGKSRPCLNFFIGQCSGVCSGKVPFSQYNEAVEDALAFIKEGGTAALADLQKRMEDAAENLEFEKAARLRDRIAAIKRLGGKQKVMSADVREQDVFALVTGAASSGRACLSVLRFADGRLYDSEKFHNRCAGRYVGDARRAYPQLLYDKRFCPAPRSVDSVGCRQRAARAVAERKEGQKSHNIPQHRGRAKEAFRDVPLERRAVSDSADRHRRQKDCRARRACGYAWTARCAGIYRII